MTTFPLRARMQRFCNVDEGRYSPLSIRGTRVGWVESGLAGAILAASDRLHHDDCGLILDVGAGSYDEVTRAFQLLIQDCLRAKIIPSRERFGDEVYPIVPSGENQAIGQMLRGYTRFFGLETTGVSVIGYTDTGLWMQRRGKDMLVSPLKLDVTSAGGCAIGVPLEVTMRNELAEEAGLQIQVALQISHAEVIKFRHEKAVDRDNKMNAIFSETVHVYDMQLPDDIVPRVQNDEVEEFLFFTYPEIRQKFMQDDPELKLNSSIVLLSFLERHGHIEIEHSDPQAYAALRSLRKEA